MTQTWLNRLRRLLSTQPRQPRRACTRVQPRLLLEILEDRLTPSGGVVPAQVDYGVTSRWNGGFGANVSITNQQTSDIKDWTVEFDYPHTITSIWNASIVDHTGDHYRIKHVDWNSTIVPNGTVSFGFNGELGDPAIGPSNSQVLAEAPTPPTPTGGSTSDGSTTPSDTANAVFQFAVSQDWGSGFGADITVTNQSGTKIDQWRLEFDFNHNIDSIWNARIISHAGNHYVIGDAGWNALLAAGGTVSFGFNGSPGNVHDVPVNFRLSGSPAETPAEAPPPEVPVPPPAETGGSPTDTAQDFQYEVTNDWSTGFNGQVTARNSGATALLAWTVEFDFAGQISSIWDANLVAQVGNHFVVQSVGWNALIPACGTVTFGFTASPGNGVVQPANFRLSGDATTAGTPPAAPSPATTTGAIVLPQVDAAQTAYQVTIAQGTTEFDLSMIGNSAARFRVFTNNGDVVQAQVADGKLRLTGIAGGRASLMIQEDGGTEVRYLGVRVRNADGSLPGLPDYVAVGSVSEDTTSDLGFWRDYSNPDSNKRIDVRYIYLNGGPVNGWRTWGYPDGNRIISYIHESQKLGIVPYFVWYNIPDGGESYYTDLEHIQGANYMQAYFRDLKFALDTIRNEAPDDPVGFILEPDFLGYIMQNSGKQADEIAALTNAAYTSGVLTAGDPQFADTVQGLVKAINYTISKYAPNVTFGWQFNLWASSGLNPLIPGNGLMHITDNLGVEAGRVEVAREAQRIAEYYMRAGILSYGAGFVSIDKYGLDAAAQVGAAANPAQSIWFWNSEHWNNYLLFNQVLHETTGMPVVLWQIPVGHINHSLAPDPYTGGLFPDLTNDFQRYEDSAGTFFLGDSFTATGARFDYFASNRLGDPKITTNGSTITWASHMQEARDAGITMVLFGAGVGESTHGTGAPPTDGYWWIAQTQDYFQQPVLLG